MTRFDIVYDSRRYSVTDRSPEQFRAEVDAALSSERPQWLSVKHGEGRANEALLLVTPQSSFAIITDDRVTAAEDSSSD